MNILMHKKSILTLLVLFAGGFVPIHLIVLSFGYAEYYKAQAIGPKIIRVAHEFAVPYLLILYIPAILFLIWAIFYTRKAYPDLYRRIVVGLAAGAIATIGLDWIRQMGVLEGWLPGDTPTMFGKMITGSNSFVEYFWIGQFAHFLNGADFGLVFTLVFGRFSTLTKTALMAIFWLLLMELGMMLGPPMGPMVGLFGIRFMWPQLFALTFVAHVVHGTILGVLAFYWLKEEDNSWLLPFLRKEV
ncbi:MAG: hypothetical protein ACE5IR_16895 [bacterium]